jgi:hypothetical protein
MTGRRGFAGIVMCAALGAASPAAASGGGAGTPLPHVTGPIPATATSYPFGAANHTLVPEDLRQVGYVEDEYLVSGKANVYTWPGPGPAEVRTPNAPYKTRILVRRPAKGSHFSGNVVVEMLNPSNQFDLNIGWAMAHRQMVRNGDAWVGITDKPIDVLALKKFDPARYGSLSFANPLALDDPANCMNPVSSVDPAGVRSRATEDGLAWDIYSQVGALLRSRDATNPLAYRSSGHDRHDWRGGHGVAVKHLYGFGYSQTGGYLYDYINAIHPLDVARNGGHPIYDGYIVAVAGAGFVGSVPINQCEAIPHPQQPPLPPLQFSNVGVPVIHVMSQSDYLFALSVRRPDSDAPADRYRHYEMAGAAHATPDELNFAAAPADIIKAGVAVPPMNCGEFPRSRFPSRIFFDAMLRNLDLWVRYGIRPPHADPITVVNGAGVLDEFGNVEGGLRSPYLDVPTSTWFGSSPGGGFCGIAGHEVPFEAARLQQLYPTHGAYVRAVIKDTARLVAGRYTTGYDGLDLIREAAQADVP